MRGEQEKEESEEAKKHPRARVSPLRTNVVRRLAPQRAPLVRQVARRGGRGGLPPRGGGRGKPAGGGGGGGATPRGRVRQRASKRRRGSRGLLQAVVLARKGHIR